MDFMKINADNWGALVLFVWFCDKKADVEKSFVATKAGEGQD